MVTNEGLDVAQELHRIAADLDALAERIQIERPAIMPWGRCAASVVSTGSLRDRLKSATEVLTDIAEALSNYRDSLEGRRNSPRSSRETRGR